MRADTAAATSTCGGGSPTGSCKHEVLDARTYAKWGIDCTYPIARPVARLAHALLALEYWLRI